MKELEATKTLDTIRLIIGGRAVMLLAVPLYLCGVPCVASQLSTIATFTGIQN